MMKRSRQRLRSWVVDGSERNCRHLVMMTAWITSTAAVQAPAMTAPTQSLERKRTAPIRGRMVRRKRAIRGKVGQISPAYAALNGWEWVAALGFEIVTMIPEGTEVRRYNEPPPPEPPLFGTAPRDTAVIEMWERRIE